MKKLHRTIILLAVLLIGINQSMQGQSNCKPTLDVFAVETTNDAKPITATGNTGKTSQQNPDYSISINGKQNTVNITTDGTEIKATETPNSLPNNNNTVEINGEGNSVNINQHDKACHVTIQQNGKGNQVNVTQSNSDK